MDEEEIVDIVGCARCGGEGHKGLLFKPLTNPIIVYTGIRHGHVTATQWAPCPTNGEPILRGTVPADG